jgi:archaellum component FlaC
MTLTEFKNKWLGKPADYDGQYGNQCVDLYRFYVKEVLGYPQSPGVGGAAEIWDSADPKYYDFITNDPNNLTQHPEPGDIVIWNRRMGGGFGHVAINLRATGTELSLLETDGTTGSGLVQQKIRSYTNVIGWLHPKELMADPLQVCLTDREKFWKERDELLSALGATDVEGGKSAIAGLKSRITDLTNQLGTAQAEVKNREEQVSRLKQQVSDLSFQLEDAVNQAKSKQQEINQFAQEKGALVVENEQLRVQVDTLKQQVTNGEITLTFKELIKLILQQKITIKK